MFTKYCNAISFSLITHTYSTVRLSMSMYVLCLINVRYVVCIVAQ